MSEKGENSRERKRIANADMVEAEQGGIRDPCTLDRLSGENKNKRLI